MSQPPCEAVSWNDRFHIRSAGSFVSLLVRLWVEIYSTQYVWGRDRVSLLVRLWVEIIILYSRRLMKSVSLLVRLWVEILKRISNYQTTKRQPPCEAVSWNTVGLLWPLAYLRQPPCEAVSWNREYPLNVLAQNQSASLWGCELKWMD